MDTRAHFRSRAEARLKQYLDSRERLELTRGDEPVVSIIVVVTDKTALALECFTSIRDQTDVPYELIVSNNSSSSSMRRLLDSLHNSTIVENHGNIGFVEAVNRAARVANGQYLLLLNDDAVVMPRAISELVRTIQSDPVIGAVGGKIILHDGTLQEAGCMVWQDGSSRGYGRGEHPDAAEYNFRRDVDYCSGCFLLTPRSVFVELGMFDEVFSPGYYEETDYCLRLWQNGYRVVYEPRAAVRHYEYGTNSRARATELMTRNRPLFVAKHPELHAHFPPGTDALAARSRSVVRGRVLVLDDRVPHPYLGSGYPRATEIVRRIHAAGFFVTLFPLSKIKLSDDTWDTVYETLPRDVEVVWNPGISLREFLESRRYFYDIILVSRPHNMRALLKACANDPGLYSYAKVVYDAEAVYAVRLEHQDRILRKPLNPAVKKRRLQEELELARPADLITTVSREEAKHYMNHGYRNVAILGHRITPATTRNSFTARCGLLFVGALHTDGSPNVDSLMWFLRHVFPMLGSTLCEDVRLTVAGETGASEIVSLAHPGVKVLGRVHDLTPLYNEHRLLIAPTRFAAGVPHKVHEAAAKGVPVVATGLLAEQLGWRHREELMVADTPGEFVRCCEELYQDPALWQAVHDAALERVARECSEEAFTCGVNAILSLDWKVKGLSQNKPNIHTDSSGK